MFLVFFQPFNGAFMLLTHKMSQILFPILTTGSRIFAPGRPVRFLKKPNHRQGLIS